MMTTKDMYEQTMKELGELLNMTKEEIEQLLAKQKGKVLIMTVTIEYATIDPITLVNLVQKQVYGTMVTFKDINEDYFELSVIGWLPLNSKELSDVERVLAPYV